MNVHLRVHEARLRRVGKGPHQESWTSSPRRLVPSQGFRVQVGEYQRGVGEEEGHLLVQGGRANAFADAFGGVANPLAHLRIVGIAESLTPTPLDHITPYA